MRTPDQIAPDRLEELLGGAVPEESGEALVQGLVRELRAEAPVTPAPLRARIRELAEQPVRRRRASTDGARLWRSRSCCWPRHSLAQRSSCAGAKSPVRSVRTGQR